MKYKKQIKSATDREWLLGTLYVVDVRTVARGSCETTKMKILMVGCEQSYIQRKLRWVFDQSRYSEFSVSGVEKVKEKVHVLSACITQAESPSRVIDRGERSESIREVPTHIERYDPKLYAVGVATTMLAADQDHALRKVGNALVNLTSSVHASGARLADGSTVTVEEISKSSGVARPRDVSHESNRAHFVRG